MPYSDLQKITILLSRVHKQRQAWIRIVTAMACVVVFVTTYALILPAITADAADLTQYLADSGGTLSAEPDVSGPSAIPGEEYPLCLSITGGEGGFSPGIYFYKLPNDVDLLTATGYDIISPENQMIGSWTANEEQTIILDFNEYAAISGIQLQLDLTIAFDGTQSTVDFDGGIRISVAMPVAETPDVVTLDAEAPIAETPAVVTPEAETPAVVTPEAETPAVVTPEAETPAVVILESETPLAEPAAVVIPEPAAPVVLASGSVDMKEYIEGLGGNITIGIYDSSGNPVDGTVVEGEQYKISLGINTGDGGFAPGTYVYRLPDGVLVEAQAAKDLVLSDGTTIGNWSVAQDGQVTFHFNENANAYQNVTLALDLIVKFDATQGDIDFDGDVNVTITPAPERPTVTPSVKKSGEVDDGDPSKLEWALSVQGGEGFPLGGQTVTDTITGNNHYYAPEDDSIWAEIYDGDTYYSWEIERDDPDITWTETSWTYTIPEVIQCVACNDPFYAAEMDPDYTGSAVHDWRNPHPLTVGDDWRAWFFYGSTITDDGDGTYINRAQAGELSDTGTVRNTTGVGITKSGELKNGEYHWYIDVTIPGSATPTNFWYLWDEMKIKPTNNSYYPSDIWRSTVTADYNGQTVNVPHYEDATAGDRFAWAYWFDEDDPNSGSEFDFLHICECTADTCPLWEGWCPSCYFDGADGTQFCRCWPETEDITFHISYKTEDSATIIANHGGSGENVRNTAGVYHKPVIDGVEQRGTWLTDSEAFLPIPGVFNKNLLSKPGAENQYTAEFNITVNEEMQDLSAMEEKDITIVDKMSKTLFYEAGSMVIQQTDAVGNTVILKENQDYTITMVNSHHLEIHILNPGPYKYTLDYRCVLDLTGYTGQAIEYNNSAEIWLFGTRYTVGGETEILTSYTASAERYNFRLEKRDFHDGTPLPGAVFGLYNEQGNLITTATTGADGKLLFETHMEDGVIFRKNMPYYIQELQAPPGYKLDETKHWFYFTKDESDALESQHPGILHIGQSGSNTYSGTLRLTNEHYMLELPETGSFGEITFYALSAAAFAAALLTGGGVLLRRRKHTR